MNNYNALLSNVFKSLKPLGFKKKNEIFYYEKYNNLGMVYFQKSRNSSFESVVFTVNLCVSSRVLRKFFNGEGAKFELDECHWKKRIGFLLPIKQDYWWKIEQDSDVDLVSDEINASLLNVAIPEIENNLSDEALEKQWRAGHGDGLTNFQRLMYLVTMLKIYNRSDLPVIANELIEFSKGKDAEATARMHLSNLGLLHT